MDRIDLQALIISLGYFSTVSKDKFTLKYDEFQNFFMYSWPNKRYNFSAESFTRF